MDLIQAHLFCEIEPKPVLKDRRQQLISKSKKVAYNKSGFVYIGFIEDYEIYWKSIKDYPKQHYDFVLHFKMTILGEDGKKTILKNPNSFVII